MFASTISAPATHSSRLSTLVGAILAVWLAVVVLLSATGQFITDVGQPPLGLLAAVLLPIIVSVVAYASSAAVRDFVRTGDPVFLTTLQSWRIFGGTFLVLLAFGMLPAAFALPAGIGDVAIALTAPFVGLAVAKWGLARVGRLFVVWQLLGILDLVVAVSVGSSLRTFPALTDATEDAGQMITLSQLPLSLIPTFGVPLCIILHLACLAQYRAQAVARERQV